jgi:hypothetical protein
MATLSESCHEPKRFVMITCASAACAKVRCHGQPRKRERTHGGEVMSPCGRAGACPVAWRSLANANARSDVGRAHDVVVKTDQVEAFVIGPVIMWRRHPGAAVTPVEVIVGTGRNSDQMRVGGTRYGNGVRHERSDHGPCRKSAVVY